MNTKYGLIVCSTENLGDDIQSLAAKQFLPRIDVYIDRDYINNINCSNEEMKLIMNGWFTHRPDIWLPPPCISPLFVSFHIDPKAADILFSRKEVIEYFQNWEPIGCRDINTLSIFRMYNIKAYFSGCLTLTLDYKYGFYTEKERNKILIVDVPQEVFRYIPKEISENAIVLTHYLFNPMINLFNRIYIIKKIIRKIIPEKYKLILPTIIDRLRAKTMSIDERFTKAEQVLKMYAQAKLVITSRLHVALPCIAFDTPVIFVHKNLNDPRFSGLLNFLNAYNIKSFKEIINTIDWEKPPKNPNREKLKDLKRKLVKICLEFTKQSNQ